MIQAAIDLGTVTSRLMIGEARGGQVEVFERSVIITNLGEGLTRSGEISHVAYARLVGALFKFRELITDFKTDMLCEGRVIPDISVKAIATSAMRDARNAEDILADLREQGFEVEVIDGSEEAELSFSGTLSGFVSLSETVMSIDVGGGSTELILGSKTKGIITSRSFDIGSRRVTEMFLESDPPTEPEIEHTRMWIADIMRDFLADLPCRPEEVIAVAGTATSAITMRDEIVDYESDLVHGEKLTKDELEGLISRLSTMTLKERKEVPGLHPGRAAVIIGGLITLSVVMDELGMERFLVSDTDILQGIILAETTIC